MSLLIRSKVKALAIAIAQESGRRQFTRVSGDFLNHIEEATRRAVADAVHRHPSIGKTLKRP